MAVKTKDETAVFEMTDESVPETVCFVCTGNTCRSPMAEALFNHIAKKEGLCVHAVSAGLAADGRSPMSPNARAVLEGAGVEFDGNFTSTPIDAKIAAKCDKIVGITSSHAMSLMMRYPQFAGKIFAMPTDIPDPYGGDISVYTDCFEAISACVKQMLLQEDDKD